MSGAFCYLDVGAKGAEQPLNLFGAFLDFVPQVVNLLYNLSAVVEWDYLWAVGVGERKL